MAVTVPKPDQGVAVVDRATTIIPQTTTTSIFTIAGGRVNILQIIGEVTTVVETQACNLSLSAVPTTGTAVAMCAVLNISADEAGCLYGITGTPADALIGTDAGLTPSQAIGQVLNVGTIGLVASASNTGNIKWQCRYSAIDDGAFVVTA